MKGDLLELSGQGALTQGLVFPDFSKGEPRWGRWNKGQVERTDNATNPEEKEDEG